MNGFNCLKHMQQFDAHNFNQNKRKNGKKNIQFTAFRIHATMRNSVKN